MADEHLPPGRTAAVLVVYHPPGPLERTLQSLARTVAVTVLVDNSEQGHGHLPALAARHGAIVLKVGNRGGLAGAYNAAIAHLQKEHAGVIDWVVLLDDDSDPTVLGVFLRDPAVVRQLRDVRTAAVAPAYRDRATGLRGKYIELDRFRLNYLSRQFTDMRPVAFVINSMSVWRMAALEQVGRFNEALAVDHVDTEYCLRARTSALSIWVHGGHVFDHAIGQRRKFRIFGRDMQAGGHSPQRRALIGRNTAWLARTWLWREPAFAFLCLTRLAYEVVGITLVEDEKPAKLAALLRGALAGLFGPLRPRQPPSSRQ